MQGLKEADGDTLLLLNGEAPDSAAPVEGQRSLDDKGKICPIGSSAQANRGKRGGGLFHDYRLFRANARLGSTLA